MKKIKFLLLTVLAITLFNCSDDDVPFLEVSVDNIAGTYDIVFYEGSSEETSTSSTGNTSVVETISFTSDTFTNATFAFDANGTYVISGSYREILTITNNSGTSTDTSIITINPSGDDRDYSLNDTNRTITLDGDIYDVTRFDGVNLFIEREFSFPVDNNTITRVERYRLVKQN